MDIKDCIRDDDLEGAIAKATELVRAAPSDASARSALFELLCFRGDLERAHKQLDVIAGESLEKAYGATALAGLLRAEEQRREVFRGATPPDFQGEDTAWAKPRMAALKGEENPGAEALEKERSTPRGTLDGEPFQDLRDGDDLLAPVLEVFAAGRYVWILWDQIASLSAKPPRALRDTCWLPVQLALRSGDSFDAHVPVLYPGSHETGEGQLMLGRATDWITGEGGYVRGVGRRVLFANGEERDILAVRELKFETE